MIGQNSVLSSRMCSIIYTIRPWYIVYKNTFCNINDVMYCLHEYVLYEFVLSEHVLLYERWCIVLKDVQGHVVLKNM